MTTQLAIDGATVDDNGNVWADGDVILIGDNVTLKNANIRKGQLDARGSNALIEDCRLMLGDVDPDGNPIAQKDALIIRSSANNVKFSHCDILWSVDDLSISGQNITFEYCLIGDSLLLYNHARGPLLRYGARNVTFYRCLFVHLQDRPLCSDGDVRFVNCVNWNVHLTAIEAYDSPVNGIFKMCIHELPPDTGQPQYPLIYNRGEDFDGRAYVEDIICPTRPTNDLLQTDCLRSSDVQYSLLTEPVFSGDPLVVLPVADVKADVLANAGARPGSTIRDLLISHAQNNTGYLVATVAERGGWPVPPGKI